MLKKRAIVILLVSILSMGLISCDNSKKVESNNKEVNSYEKTEKILGTVVSGVAYGDNAKEALEKAFNRAKDIENMMSVNIENSELSKVNSEAFHKNVKLSDDLYYVIEKSIYYANLTDGALDPTIGHVIDSWGIGTEHANIPEKTLIDKYK
ncbi:MAG: FAD:protein FMN transferase, partial [Clostridium perfringens]